MRVAVTGASGFLGKALCQDLLESGHTVLAISRTPGAYSAGSPEGLQWSTLEEADLSGCDAVVNWAGEALLPGRWTQKKKERICRSRVEGTRLLLERIAQAEEKPEVLISASGVAYYGHRVDAAVTESSPPGEDFLSKLCVDWEAAAESGTRLGIRVVHMRLAVVLGKDGGALHSMAPIFKWGVGGPIGSGRQPFPWVDQRDVLRFVKEALVRKDVTGAFNLVADSPPQRAFSKCLGQSLKRPAVMPAPAFALRMMYGEGAEALLGGQNVRSERLETVGCSPHFVDLKTVLDFVFGAQVSA